MIPLRDDIPVRRFTVVTFLLIGVNSAIFLWEVALGTSADAIIWRFGFVPARLIENWAAPGEWLTLFTSMYLHGSWAHLISNMLYLWIFGNNVEDNMGRARFFVFYTLCGVLAALAETAAPPSAALPGIGASGAIAGVLGAYLLLYPRARVEVLLPLLFWWTTITLPAALVLGGWFLLQFFNGLMSLNLSAQLGGVAWWAHIGGFVAGLLFLPLFRQKRPPYHSRFSGAERDAFYRDQFFSAD